MTRVVSVMVIFAVLSSCAETQNRDASALMAGAPYYAGEGGTSATATQGAPYDTRPRQPKPWW